MKIDLPFSDRSEAGRVLAVELSPYKFRQDVQVLGLAHGGLAVAAEIAAALQAPLDALAVRKISLASQPELALGAIAVDGTKVLDEEIIRCLCIPANVIDALTSRLKTELERRERLYHSSRPPLDLNGQTVILVDDGLASGSTMLAAVRFARKRFPAKLVLAVPVAAATAIAKLRPEVDECVCLATPEWFYAVAEWYDAFPQLTDAEVTRLLEANRMTIESLPPVPHACLE
jgi:putative phosphoribosyl transferase